MICTKSENFSRCLPALAEASGTAEVERGRKAGHRHFLRVGTRGRSAPFFFCSKADCFHRRWRFSLASCHSNSDGMSGSEGGGSLALRSLFFLPDRRCEVWLSAGCALRGGADRPLMRLRKHWRASAVTRPVPGDAFSIYVSIKE